MSASTRPGSGPLVWRRMDNWGRVQIGVQTCTERQTGGHPCGPTVDLRSAVVGSRPSWPLARKPLGCVVRMPPGTCPKTAIVR
jgi:hypothetical protein